MLLSAVISSRLTHEFRGAPRLSRAKRRALFGIGFRSMLSIGLAPFGTRAAPFHRTLAVTSRLEHGLIIILPGIEGCSSINDSIARGLIAGQLSHAVKIIDWRKFRPWNPFHLVMSQHNRRQARQVADLICDYQKAYPGQPVHLIGHSAGAGIALFVLEALPKTHKVDSVVLMAAAVSRQFDIQPLLERTRRGIWNFYSPLDLPTVGLGTIVFGTMDRRHAISAGALGFRVQSNKMPTGPNDDVYGVGMGSCDKSNSEPQLFQIKFRIPMMKSWHFGGHFGFTNAVFVQQHVVPVCS